MNALYAIERELIADLAEEINALIETVEQRDIHARLHCLENHAGKARARSDVNDLFIFKVTDLQKCSTVKKMQPRDILCTAYGGQVHDTVSLLEVFKICFKPLDRFGIRRNAERSKAFV